MSLLQRANGKAGPYPSHDGAHKDDGNLTPFKIPVKNSAALNKIESLSTLTLGQDPARISMRIRLGASLFTLGSYLVVAVLATAPRLASAADRATLIFPRNRRMTWIYAGTDREIGASNVHIRNWKMSVLKTAHRGDVTLWYVQGLPLGPSDYSWIIVQNTAGLFIKQVGKLLAGPELDKLMEKALNSQLKFVYDNYVLRFPVRVGDCLSLEPNSLETKYWCWHVQSAVKTPYGSGWEVEYRTNPDQSVLNLVPGVGVTRYVYHDFSSGNAYRDFRLVRMEVAQPDPLRNKN